jgi:hypothetical protein
MIFMGIYLPDGILRLLETFGRITHRVWLANLRPGGHRHGYLGRKLLWRLRAVPPRKNFISARIDGASYWDMM